MSKRTRLALGDENTDECLRTIARRVIRQTAAVAPPGGVSDWQADALYDQVIAIHEARKAIRTRNTRKRSRGAA